MICHILCWQKCDDNSWAMLVKIYPATSKRVCRVRAYGQFHSSFNSKYIGPKSGQHFNSFTTICNIKYFYVNVYHRFHGVSEQQTLAIHQRPIKTMKNKLPVHNSNNTENNICLFLISISHHRFFPSLFSYFYKNKSHVAIQGRLSWKLFFPVRSFMCQHQCTYCKTFCDRPLHNKYSNKFTPYFQSLCSEHLLEKDHLFICSLYPCSSMRRPGFDRIEQLTRYIHPHFGVFTSPDLACLQTTR